MDKYIKLDTNNNVIDVFFSYQKNKFKGTEILVEENITLPHKHKINNKNISNEEGLFLFKYENNSFVEKTQKDIEAEFDFAAYKKRVWKEIFGTLQNNLFVIIVNKRKNGTPTFNSDDVLLKAQQFKENNSELNTIEEINSAKQQVIDWMGLV